jgi:hypothetical protein
MLAVAVGPTAVEKVVSNMVVIIQNQEYTYQHHGTMATDKANRLVVRALLQRVANVVPLVAMGADLLISEVKVPVIRRQ